MIRPKKEKKGEKKAIGTTGGEKNIGSGAMPNPSASSSLLPKRGEGRTG